MRGGDPSTVRSAAESTTSVPARSLRNGIPFRGRFPVTSVWRRVSLTRGCEGTSFASARCRFTCMMTRIFFRHARCATFAHGIIERSNAR
eukprot:1070442-Alexandrium_andersonii.AAC.1